MANGKEKPHKELQRFIRKVVSTWGSQRASRTGYAEIGEKSSFRGNHMNHNMKLVKYGGVHLEQSRQYRKLRKKMQIGGHPIYNDLNASVEDWIPFYRK